MKIFRAALNELVPGEVGHPAVADDDRGVIADHRVHLRLEAEKGGFVGPAVLVLQTLSSDQPSEKSGCSGG